MPIRPQWIRRPPLADVALAVAQTVAAFLLGNEYHDQWRPLDLTGYLLTALACMPTAFRRQAPVAVLVLCAGAWFWSISAGYWPALNCYGSLVAFYTVAMERPQRVTLTAAIALSAEWIYAAVLAERGSVLSAAAQAVTFLGVLWKFGDNAQKLVKRNEELAALSDRLRQEQANGAYRAVVEERMRIAGELHDVVAHHMSVISVQAGMAGYVFDTEPATARTALGVIANTSREAQEELRRMLTLLRRRNGAGPTPGDLAAPGVGQLDVLVDRMRAAGVHTELVVHGTPQPLPPGPDLCAYRVIQESFTNVLKHAGPAAVTVTLEFVAERFTVRVADTGRGPAVGYASGHGLVGMQERASLYGGTLTAGPRPTGGFEVELTLPLRATGTDLPQRFTQPPTLV